MILSVVIGSLAIVRLFGRVFVHVNTILTNNGAKCQGGGKIRMIYIHFYN